MIYCLFHSLPLAYHISSNKYQASDKVHPLISTVPLTLRSD